MIAKKNRLDRKLIEEIFKNGKFLSSSDLTFKFIQGTSPILRRISFIAPKAVAKSSVKRNLLRRRGYAALKKHLGKFPASIIGAFVFKRYQQDISIIENEIENILNKIN